MILILSIVHLSCDVKFLKYASIIHLIRGGSFLVMFNICTSLQKIRWDCKKNMVHIAWTFAVFCFGPSRIPTTL